jgi:hypothetical protein
MAIFVAQVYGEPGTSDMWSSPWAVITVDGNPSQDDILRATERIEEPYDYTNDTVKVNKIVEALTAAGFTGVQVALASAVNFNS